MKRFLNYIGLFIGFPIVFLLVLFFMIDPFKTLHAFDINDVDDVNREYLSTELFLRNYEKEQYNSFMFCSSRGLGLNTYLWKIYLGEDAKPFLFQAWSETVTGIALKLEWMEQHNIDVKNAFIMLDIPGSFASEQLSSGAMYIKHYQFTGEPQWWYNTKELWNFMQSPSLWMSRTKKFVTQQHEAYGFDTLTNDYYLDNRINYMELLPQDSLNGCSGKTKLAFIASLKENALVEESVPLVDKEMECVLERIAGTLRNLETNYVVVLSPAYCYTSPKINSADLTKLKRVFGEDKVYDFTGENEWNKDYNNFSDPNHFGRRVGTLMMKEIYE